MRSTPTDIGEIARLKSKHEENCRGPACPDEPASHGVVERIRSKVYLPSSFIIARGITKQLGSFPAQDRGRVRKSELGSAKGPRPTLARSEAALSSGLRTNVSRTNMDEPFLLLCPTKPHEVLPEHMKFQCKHSIHGQIQRCRPPIFL